MRGSGCTLLSVSRYHYLCLTIRGMPGVGTEEEMRKRLALWLSMYDFLVDSNYKVSNECLAVTSEQYWLFWPGHGREGKRALADLVKAAFFGPRWGLAGRGARIQPPSLILHMPALLYPFLVPVRGNA